ncbi:MAG: aminodeoxychorismate synthase component I [Desulfobacterales bacterium]|nr:aminodeoxychorismate synthase component I [Desulfobacterales bacterium]
MMMDELKETIGEITGIHTERIVIDEPFSDFASCFAHIPGTVVLMSGGNPDCARYHILGIEPWLAFSGRGRNMAVRIKDKTFHFEADPFDTLRNLLNMFRLDNPDLPIPVAAGLMGYLSYDLKDSLEKLPRTSTDNLRLPHICLFAPSVIIIQDKADNTSWLCIPQVSNFKFQVSSFKFQVSSFKFQKGNFSGNTGGFRSNFTRPDYINAITRIREYIASGHVYQVNMSQRFETDFQGDPFTLFRTLYDMNPAPFFAYVNAGDHQIVSTSPERFILRKGNMVETRPIKGTRPRGKTPDQDEKLRLELKQSRKDDSELSMIVDLLRNDIGKVCKASSVRVTEHKRLEAYQNVYHLVSVVEGTLDKGCDSVDLIKATFPGGSITGCPKIRSMEIIDELEPDRRHIYTGSIGYISFHDTMDLSIAIRTATIYGGKIIFSVGGGIIFDSDPADEYDETLHKGRTLMDVFKGKEKIPGAKQSETVPCAWINGVVKPLDKANINIASQGFQFGYGFFETIRVVNKEARYLKEHIDRFNKTWKSLFPGETPDLTWDEIIDQVISGNGLSDKTAAVKIIAAKGNREFPPFDHNLAVMARPYIHRLAEKKEPGLNLATYPHPRQTPLADHKTLNYLYYFQAGKWAKDQGFDEALIMNPDKTVSETNTANILLINGKKIIAPVSSHVLPGITENAICGLLSEWGYRTENKKIRLGDFFSAQEVIVTNSLMGAVPILSLDGKKTGLPSGLCRTINDVIL